MSVDTEEIVIQETVSDDEILFYKNKLQALTSQLSAARNDLVTNRAVARKGITDGWDLIIGFAQRRKTEMLGDNDTVYNGKSM
jgi:hypothetical protein